MSLRKVITKKVSTIFADSTVYQAAQIMRESHVGDLVVIEKQNGRIKPIGILTDRDIVMSTTVYDLVPSSISVEDIMGPFLIVAKISDNFYHIIDLMKKHGLKRIPLVNDQGNLEGIISADDILGMLAEELKDLTKVIKIQKNIEIARRPKFA